MKRMLIIGNEYAGVKSVSFDKVNTVNITDYQILLIDLTTYQDIGQDLITYIRVSTASLHGIRHPIVCILPRENYDDRHCRIFPFFTLRVETKSGSTVVFDDTVDLMNV